MGTATAAVFLFGVWVELLAGRERLFTLREGAHVGKLGEEIVGKQIPHGRQRAPFAFGMTPRFFDSWI